jgi:hypothetical protein
MTNELKKGHSLSNGSIFCQGYFYVVYLNYLGCWIMLIIPKPSISSGSDKLSMVIMLLIQWFTYAKITNANLLMQLY